MTTTATAAMADGLLASAATSFSLDGNAGIVGRDGIEYDSLSHRVQMILLMDKNASKASNESLSSLFVKKLYEDVMSKRDMIISMVVAEKPELEIMITDALDAPFNVQGKHPPAGERAKTAARNRSSNNIITPLRNTPLAI
jgi:hypothetical protein